MPLGLPFGRKPVLVRIEARVPWIVAQDRRDGHWFGICPPLNINAAGDTFAEFTQCAEEAMTLLLQSLHEHGEFDDFMRRHGWRAATPVPSRGTPTRFDVPIEISHRNRVEELVGAL